MASTLAKRVEIGLLANLIGSRHCSSHVHSCTCPNDHYSRKAVQVVLIRSWFIVKTVV